MPTSNLLLITDRNKALRKQNALLRTLVLIL